MTPRATNLTARLRQWTRVPLEQVGAWGVRAGLHPDAVTVAGLVIVLVAAIFIGRGTFVIGGLLLVVGLPLDALDGAIARAMNRRGQFGAFLDSTLDRYADGFLFGALAYYYASVDNLNGVLLAIIALIGTFVVSYTRARAEGLGAGSIRDGLFDRLVRVIVLIVTLISGWVLPGLIILAVGTQFTAVQRIWIVRRTMAEIEQSPESRTLESRTLESQALESQALETKGLNIDR